MADQPNVRIYRSSSKSTETFKTFHPFPTRFPATPYPSAFSVSFSAASGCFLVSSDR